MYVCTSTAPCTAVFRLQQHISDICNSIFISTPLYWKNLPQILQSHNFSSSAAPTVSLISSFSIEVPYFLISATLNSPYSQLNLQKSPSNNALKQLSPLFVWYRSVLHQPATAFIETAQNCITHFPLQYCSLFTLILFITYPLPNSPSATRKLCSITIVYYYGLYRLYFLTHNTYINLVPRLFGAGN